MSILPAYWSDLRGRIAAIRASAPGTVRHLLRSETQWLWVLVPGIVLTAYVFILNWHIWNGPSKVLQFQPFIPIGAAVAVYFQRFETAELYSELVFVYPEDSPKRRGKLWLALFGCLFLLAATYSSLGSVAVIGYIITVIGGIYFLYGPIITRDLWRPLIFLVLMMPPPSSYMAQVSGHLQSGTAFVACQLLHLVFHDAQVIGPIISLPGFLLEIGPAAGGLAVLLPVLCLTLLFAMFRQITVNVAVIILFIAVIISLLLNVLRIVTIGLMSGINVDLASQWLDGAPFLVTILAFYLTYLTMNAVLRPQRKLSEFELDLQISSQFAGTSETNGEG